MKLPSLTKKTTILTLALCSALVGGVSAAITDSGTTGASDKPPIVKQVEHHEEVLGNHEARITNTESDVQDLQNKTGTPPSTTRVEVPVPSPAPKPEPTPTPVAPVTITAFREIVIDSGTSDCEYTYSDGTNYQWHWKTTNPQGAWVTDGQGQNGHWVATTQTSGYCSQQAIGQVKSN